MTEEIRMMSRITLEGKYRKNDCTAHETSVLICTKFELYLLTNSKVGKKGFKAKRFKAKLLRQTANVVAFQTFQTKEVTSKFFPSITLILSLSLHVGH